MYEQDYIIRMNNEVIRTMVKLLLNKDTGVPIPLARSTHLEKSVLLGRNIKRKEEKRRRTERIKLMLLTAARSNHFPHRFLRLHNSRPR